MEKTIIVGKLNQKLTSLILKVGLAFVLLFLLLFLLNVDHCRHYVLFDGYEYNADLLSIIIFDGASWFVSAILDLGLILIIWGVLFYVACVKTAITVTDKRVYGTALWRKRVDLPFDSISAVSTTIFKGVGVATSSGLISFKLIDNNKEVHKAISDLLIKRQEMKHTNIEPIVVQSPSTSTTEELKKYKELLDSGVITQEEFDAKKKQLMGL